MKSLSEKENRNRKVSARTKGLRHYLESLLQKVKL
ncbi:MAG: hypothetical protein EOO46_01125 [Flavobacterium sp.]|nr:MAG: hypothetical protein EOO46_01125 [Flavobacterium sp.]